MAGLEGLAQGFFDDECVVCYLTIEEWKKEKRGRRSCVDRAERLGSRRQDDGHVLI